MLFFIVLVSSSKLCASVSKNYTASLSVLMFLIFYLLDWLQCYSVISLDSQDPPHSCLSTYYDDGILVLFIWFDHFLHCIHKTSSSRLFGVGLGSVETKRWGFLRRQVSQVLRSLISIPSSPSDQSAVLLKTLWPVCPRRWCQRCTLVVFGTCTTPSATIAFDSIARLCGSNGWLCTYIYTYMHILRCF